MFVSPRTIFLPSLGQELSRDAFVVSVYAFEEKFDWRKGFCMTQKNRKIFDFSSFRRMSPEASIEYLGSFRSVQDVFWSCSFEFSSSKKKFENIDFLMSA